MYIYLHFIMFVTLKMGGRGGRGILSPVITLIIIKDENFPLFVFHELNICNVYFIRNISIYQADGSKTTGLFLQHPLCSK